MNLLLNNILSAIVLSVEVHHRSTSGPHLSGPNVDLYWVPNKPVPKRTGNKLVCDLIRSKVFSAQNVFTDSLNQS